MTTQANEIAIGADLDVPAWFKERLGIDQIITDDPIKLSLTRNDGLRLSFSIYLSLDDLDDLMRSRRG